MAVVLTREVAISDAVAAAQAGLVIEPDREALAISLTALLQDPALAQKCGRNARRLTIEQFSWHIVTRKLIQMYDRVRQGHHDQAAAGE
jgi:glycosyltransferase involved in cell wall biosynthesis